MRISFQQHFYLCFDGRETEFYIVSSRREVEPQQFADDLSTTLGLVFANKVAPMIGKVWPFLRAKEALQSIAQNTHVGIQIVQIEE